METHISVAHSAKHLKHPLTGAPRTDSDGVIVHWTSRAPRRNRHGLLSMVDCLLDVLRCQEPDIAFAVLESAISRRLLSRSDRRLLEHRVVGRMRRVVENAGDDAGSGTESLFRFRMLLLGVVMQSQVEIGGVGRVDFVIGDRLVVEIDSDEHHSGAANRLRDLNRDMVLAGLGFITLRFDYQQVMHDWESVATTVLAVIDRRDHLYR